MEILPTLFLEKCKVRKVKFSEPKEFFDKTLIDYVAKTWEQTKAKFMTSKLETSGGLEKIDEWIDQGGKVSFRKEKQ